MNSSLVELKLILQFKGLGYIPDAEEASAARSARSLLPSFDLEPCSFVINGSKEGGGSFTKTSSGGKVFLELEPGNWEFIAEAKGGTGEVLARGEENLVLEAGLPRDLQIELLPLGGNGSFSIDCVLDRAAPLSARLRGGLKEGSAEAGFAVDEGYLLHIDQEFGSGEIRIPEVPAGYYVLELRLEAENSVIAGLAESVLILAGYSTSAACQMRLSAPSVTFSLTMRPFSQLACPNPPPFHETNARIAIPIDMHPVLADLKLQCFYNGQRVEADAAGRPILPSTEKPGPGRLDIIGFSQQGEPENSVSAWFHRSPGPSAPGIEWLARYDRRALPGAIDTGIRPGASAQKPVRALAATRNRLIPLVAAAGLDSESRIHVFMLQGNCLFPLFSEEIRVAGSLRNPDILAFSPEGRFVAAASSASSWISLIELDPRGGRVARLDARQGDGGLPSFNQIRGLSFSSDGQRLFALANSPGRLYSFDLASGRDLEPDSSIDLEALKPGASQGFADLKSAGKHLMASAAGAERIYVFATEPSLELCKILDSASLGSFFQTPGKITLCQSGIEAYVLCEGKGVLGIRYATEHDDWDSIGYWPLAGEASDAEVLSLDSREERLIVAGGGAVSSYARDCASGLLGSMESLDESSAAQSLGIAGAVDISAVPGLILLAGGLDSSVSVLRLMPNM